MRKEIFFKIINNLQFKLKKNKKIKIFLSAFILGFF